MKPIFAPLIALSVFVAACASTAAPFPQSVEAASSVTPGPGREDMQGWREIVFTVADLDVWIETLEMAGGWEVRHRGVADRRHAPFWGAYYGTTFETVLMANPGEDTGFIRLVRVSGGTGELARPNDQPWDTGAIFNTNARVVSMTETRSALMRRGWNGDSEPIEFAFGPFVVQEWIPRGPDGIRMAFVERIEPPLEGWPNLRKMSRVFNSTQMVADMDRALAFYTQTLGWKVYLESRRASSEPGPNVLGLPHNLTDDIVREVYILHPQGTNEGSVELVAFEGAQGRDFGADASPLKRGIAALRFPVDNATAFAVEMADKGQAPVAPLSQIDLPPYGVVDIIAFSSPEGARLEFFSPAREID